MGERRSLIDGIKTAPPATPTAREQEFVYGKTSQVAEPALASSSSADIPSTPFSTRIRGDYAEALKRASLERQLKKMKPCTIREILEVSLEPWLKANGYLP